MLSKLVAVMIPVSLALSGAALAQTKPSDNPACSRTKALANDSGSNTTTSMADTSSGMGASGSGASSASIGTGKTDKIGVYSPCVPATAGNSATGAMPGSTPKAPTQ